MRLLHGFAGPLNLLGEIIFIHCISAVKYRTATPCFAGVKDDEGDRSVSEGIVEGSRIVIREDVGYQLRIVSATFVVSAGEEYGQSCRKCSERLQFISDQSVSHVVARTDDVSVQEEKVGGGRVDLSCKGAILTDLHMYVIEYGESAGFGLRIECPDALSCSFVAVSEARIARIAVVGQVFSTDTVTELCSRFQSIDTDSMQPSEYASPGEGIPNLGSVR